jgi:hypothetical protein
MSAAAPHGSLASHVFVSAPGGDEGNASHPSAPPPSKRATERRNVETAILDNAYGVAAECRAAGALIFRRHESRNL